MEHDDARFNGLVVRGNALLLAGRAEEAACDFTMAPQLRGDVVTVYSDR